MELEQRVKTLEYEFKILKNELQRTLLDIQEQVLVHYYPTLRAEETAPSLGTIQALEAVRAKQGSAVVTPAAKKVSLDPVRETASAPEAMPTQTKLLQWSVQSAAKFGSARAQKLIEVYGARGAFPPPVCATLTELALLGEHPGPAKIALDDLIRELTKLDELVGRVTNVEEMLAVIKESDLG